MSYATKLTQEHLHFPAIIDALEANATMPQMSFAMLAVVLLLAVIVAVIVSVAAFAGGSRRNKRERD